MSAIFERIRSTAIDGYAANIFYRQRQLCQLRDALVENAPQLKEALTLDSGHTESEVNFEFLLALESILDSYSSLDVDQEKTQEFAIAHSRDAPTHEEAVGIVIIEPAAHTFLFSVIDPLSAAITAGSCVIIQIEKSTAAAPALLAKILEAKLNNDSFQISESTPTAKSVGYPFQRVIQNQSTTSPQAWDLVSDGGRTRVIAIVERNCDIVGAADSLVNAQFSFGGRSPYAPDVVLVNEWVKKEFTEACIQAFIRYTCGSNGPTTRASRCREEKRRLLSFKLQEIKREGKARVAASWDEGAIVEVEQRNSVLLQHKTVSGCLIIHAVSSMDDAIDLSNRCQLERILALYSFAPPRESKYICQFIKSRVAFINQIPHRLLVGPVYPFDYPISARTRYPSSLFKIQSPKFLVPWSNISPGLSLTHTLDNSAVLESIERVVVSFPNGKRSKRASGRDIGFFDQGIITGALLLLTPVLIGIGFLGLRGFS